MSTVFDLPKYVVAGGIWTGKVLGKFQALMSSKQNEQPVPENRASTIHGEQLSATEMERRMKLLTEDR